MAFKIAWTAKGLGENKMSMGRILFDSMYRHGQQVLEKIIQRAESNIPRPKELPRFEGGKVQVSQPKNVPLNSQQTLIGKWLPRTAQNTLAAELRRKAALQVRELPFDFDWRGGGRGRFFGEKKFSLSSISPKM